MQRVEVEVFNRRTKFLGDYPRKEIQAYFKFRPPNYRYMPAYKKFHEDPDTGEMVRRWDGYVNLLKRNRVGTGLFLSMKERIEKELGLKFVVRDRRKVLRYKPISMDGSRPYQTSCVVTMQESITGGIILAATRVGKTWIAGKYFESMPGCGVFIVDQIDLLLQAKKELEEVIGERVGIIGDTKFRPRRITVATIQTLHLHSGEKLTQLEKKKGYKPSPYEKDFQEWKKTLKAVFIDELHVQLNKRSFSVVNEIKSRLVFGMTATLEMKKERIRLLAMNLCGPVIFEYGIDKGVSQGYLTPGVVVSAEVRQYDHEVIKYRDAYNELIVFSEERNKVITDLVKTAHDRGRSVLVLTERVKHLKILSKSLEALPHAVVYGKKEAAERIQATKDFDAKKTRLIIANKVFKKGITIKAVDTIVECAALVSKNDAVQKFGRGIGLCKGKKGLIYFDISDRSIEGVTKENAEWNRFNKATGSRLLAFRKKGIKVVKLKLLELAFGSRNVLNKAEEALEKEIERVEKERHQKAGKVVSKV